METKVLCALRFFATGSYQNLVSSDISVGVSQAFVSSCIRAMLAAIVAVATENSWVQFPTTPEEKATTKQEFLRHGNIDGVVGCANGTLVNITKPEHLNPGETQGFFGPRRALKRCGYNRIGPHKSGNLSPSVTAYKYVYTILFFFFFLLIPTSRTVFVAKSYMGSVQYYHNTICPH